MKIIDLKLTYHSMTTLILVLYYQILFLLHDVVYVVYIPQGPNYNSTLQKLRLI